MATIVSACLQTSLDPDSGVPVRFGSLESSVVSFIRVGLLSRGPHMAESPCCGIKAKSSPSSIAFEKVSERLKTIAERAM